ncbi:TetR/AcrR family transcriptional regulator [Desulforegula conservatrix]|uniref:TetR/AcrR family transcriptional regulator n=1 Tax=Desulforegula conservatrix TaxID=153026 RepID=UPI000423E67D|nr:TetR/AcrR family transcriptional regulator [Desulforegula conservatrix]
MCKPDKREEIVKAAMELIAENGFHGAPMALIAEKAGVGAGTIYRYFENKDVLIWELYHDLDERFKSYLMADYPEGRPVRECFFYIGRMMIKYLKNNPLDFKYSEQFHNSPYGVEFRRNKIFNFSGKYDFCRDIYEKGREQQVIKDVPMPIFFDLAFAPFIWALRDHLLGFVDLDDELSNILVSSCWDSVKM